MGAVFSSGGATVSYDDGIQAAASGTAGTGGTQRNEFEAAIKSVTSSTTVGAVFIYDTSQDSDGGKWRSKTSHTSWAREASSATRSARSEFPAMALIVADNVSANNETVTVYDLDDPAMPVWMVLQSPGSLTWSLGSGTSASIKGLYALNGRLFVGFGGGLVEYNFPGDDIRLGEINPYYLTSGRTIASRNAASSYAAGGDGYAIVNATVNDVAMTVLEGAEIGALGMPIPTVAVATGGGISVILPSGTVNDSSSTAAYTGVEFDHNGGLFATYNHATDSWFSRCEASAYHTNASDFSPLTITETGHGSASSFTPNFLGSAPKIAKLSNDGFAVGTDAALNLYKLNTANGAESMVSHHTSSYATGYMVGDIRGAWLANNGTDGTFEDRCVKANDLTEVGTVTEAEVATGAELNGYNNFSASNYLTITDTDQGSDFDFGTNDFSVMFWCKSAATGSYEDYVARTDATPENGDWIIEKSNAEKLTLYRSNGSAWQLQHTSTGTVGTSWTQVAAVRRNGKFNWYLNGEFDSSGSDTNNYTPSGGSSLTVGQRLDAPSSAATNASLSLLRISGTAPSPAQIKAIYEAEKPLFAANAKCLLQSDDGSYSDLIRDLAFDKSSGILSATQYSATAAGVTKFRGLEVVDTFNGKDHGWDDEHTQFATSAGGVTAFSSNSTGCGVLVDLPALDVRAELNEGEDKIPDDGRWHFSGVTTDATATCIGQIPVAENEQVTVIARVSGHKYNDPSTADWVNCEIERVSQRAIGGSMGGRTVSRKLLDIGTAAIDVAQWHGTNTVKLMVTGLGSTRIVWKASVEVQRISEKQYER